VGFLHGHRADAPAPPALLLHGGAAVPDYLEGLAAEFADLFATIRYTQRGTPPSAGGPPFSIESHMDDAVAILDAFAIEQAWVVGHSWGGHLGLHLLVAHPERIRGFVGIAALGAVNIFAEQDANLRRGLTPAQVARVEEVEAKRRRGEVTEADLVERLALLWPQFFADQANAALVPQHIGAEASAGTNASIMAHLERATLVEGLPAVRVPCLFVHGERDAMPLRSATETAALIPDAEVAPIPDCGHFPWIERPGVLRRIVEAWLP
jgi:pimeloyl-ACP methyl ester carboxylesterase